MEIAWREANSNDVGQLARFCDRKGDDWVYGLLHTFNPPTELNRLESFVCLQIDCDCGEVFFICEVQECGADKLKAALAQIAEYGIGADRNDGICPYGCDCPHIAQEALKAENQIANPPQSMI